MAQYRFSAQVIGRSSGRSSVAAAAYRAGTSIADERTGIVHDFSRRRGVLHAEIMAPDNAPEWMHDRSRLWNAVEKIETRTNSQLAREIQLSLPHELTDAQRLELVRSFARDQFVSQGMIADIAIHAPSHEGDDRNHHAHVMLTMRELMGDGFHTSKATPTARAWNAKENIEQWREAWCEHQNRTFQRLGLDVAVDHRSLAAQGIDREPTVHLGSMAADMERNGKPSRIGDQNRGVEDRNNARNDNDRAAVIVNLDLERLKREQERVLYDRQNALQSAQALSALDLDMRQHGQKIRLEAQLAALYGEPKQNLTASIAPIAERLKATGFKKVLRDLAGRTRRDLEQIHGITRTLEGIQLREADARNSMERVHMAEREAQKLAQAKQQQDTAARVAAEFERKRADAIRQQAAVAARQRAVELAAQDRNRPAPASQDVAKRRASWTRPTPPPSSPENQPVKKDFDKARELERIALNRPAPIMAPERLSTPAPQPTPAGVPSAAPMRTHAVPQIDKAAEWAKTAQGRAELARNAPAPQPTPAFEKSAAPVMPKPPEVKPQTRAEYWSERARQTQKDKPEQERNRTRDLDYDRDR